MSHPVGKQTLCIGENKGADQLCSNCEADQRLCFRYTDCTIPLLSKAKIGSLKPSVTVQPGLCQTCWKTTLLVFPRGGSYFMRNYAYLCMYIIIIMYEFTDAFFFNIAIHYASFGKEICETSKDY